METWKINISAPMGDVPATLRIAEDGLSGEMEGKSGNGPMNDFVVDGPALSWTTKIDRPMPMTLTFKGTRDGDRISGKVRFGMFASGSFQGSRIEQAA